MFTDQKKKNYFLLSFWIILTISASCASSQPRRAQKQVVRDMDWYIDTGIDAFARKDYDQAIASWEMAIQKRPRNARVHNFLGLAYMNRSDYGRAMLEFEQAIEIDPGFAEAYNHHGSIMFKQRKYAEAMESYQHALAIDPDYTVARQNFKLALEASAGNLDGWAFTLAEEAARAEDLDQKIALYTRALDVDSTYAKVHNNLGTALYYDGKLRQAITSLEQAIKLDSELAESYNNLGYIYNDLERYNEAIDHFKLALEIDPYYTDAYNNLAYALMKSEDVDNAIATWETVLRIEPSNRLAKRYLYKYRRSE